MRRHALTLAFWLATLATASAQAPGWGGALWVWDAPNANTSPQSNDARHFRHRFSLPETPVAAELWVTVDNIYVAHLNGKKLGGDAAWESVDRYDVAKLLVKGDNVFAIEARNQGGVAGAIARLWVRLPDKSEKIVGTGIATKANRVADKGWTEVAFDDSAWAGAAVLGDASIGPWSLTDKSGGKKGKTQAKSTDVASDGKIKERLSAKEEAAHLSVPKGFAVELVASEPDVINPVTMAVDDRGRILVSESHTYRYGPKGSPVKPFRNPLVRLEPKAGGGFERVVVADGFDDPVMGIAVRGNQLWVTANNYLYRYDYPESGPATNKTTLVVDKNKAWNPFGMFVIEFGLDGLLYLSVGDHKIALEGPTNSLDSRGTSGIIARMNPDGSNLERLTQGFRVPYSFEFDPFGQLWVLSNGEGNPNRFARIIRGVDYHCYTRKPDNTWLAGNHPLAPPVFELPRGAHTQLMRYYGAAYPPEYHGSLFLDNWGAHGFHGVNRAVFRYVPDERGKIGTKEPFLSCNDPHFRPAHVCLDPDGNLLVADWYGRDDESDLTGRIWRVRYVGGEAPKHVARTPAEGLDSPSHVVRAQAADQLVKSGAIDVLREHAAGSKSPLGAASALWALVRIGTAPAKDALLAGAKHADPRVRRLALDLGRRALGDAAVQATAKTLASDADPAVRVEAALALGTADAALAAVTSKGVASDEHLRYEIAAALARVARAAEFDKLLGADEPDLRLAGQIAVDVACYEKLPTKPTALLAVARGLSGAGDLESLLFLAQTHGDPSVLPAIDKLVSRTDLPAAVSSKAMIAYRALTGKLPPTAGKQFLEGVRAGTIALVTHADRVALLELLESEGPTPFSIEQLGREIRANQPQVKPAALALARRFGPKSGPIADALWPSVLNPKTKSDEALDALATLAVVEAAPRTEAWTRLLEHSDSLVRVDAIRWLRTFKKDAVLGKTLVDRAEALVKSDPALSDDLATTLKELGLRSPAVPEDDGKRDKTALAKSAADSLAQWSPAERQRRALLGKQVFERSACVKCHTAVTQATALAPSLKGIGTQKVDYLVESILEPSKVIKTGFETEVIVTTAGRTLSGLVKDEGTHLRVQNADLDVRLAKTDVESRATQKRSIMPDGQEALLSRREFVDLIAYLSSLK